MPSAALSVLALLASGAAAAAPSPGERIAAVASIPAPAGWSREEYANGGGADPVLAFSDGADRISVRLYGSPGSAYKTPAAFLKSPAASTLGRPPQPAGKVSVAGREIALYRRGFPLEADAAPGGPLPMGWELFGLLPVPEGRFLVLTLAHESDVPDPQDRGRKAWRAFLRGLKRAGRKA